MNDINFEDSIENEETDQKVFRNLDIIFDMTVGLWDMPQKR